MTQLHQDLLLRLQGGAKVACSFSEGEQAVLLDLHNLGYVCLHGKLYPVAFGEEKAQIAIAAYELSPEGLEATIAMGQMRDVVEAGDARMGNGKWLH